MIIALSGWIGSGKNTVADYMGGYKQLSFAGPLKEAVYKLNPIVTHIDGKYTLPIATAVDNIGWEKVKTEYIETRQYLQRMGTEVGRNMFGQEFWVDQALKRIDCPCVVFTDTRFPNEANAIRESYSGLVIRVTRPEVGKISDHISETALDDYEFDEEIINDGTPAQLQLAVTNLLRRYNAQA